MFMLNEWNMNVIDEKNQITKIKPKINKMVK